MIRVVLPHHLRKLAQVGEEVELEISGVVTQGNLLGALELAYPALRGAIRDQTTRQRRPFVRFFGCGQDLSHELADTPLPEAVSRGAEPFFVVGAMAGG